jgi:hypothetical protein
MVPVSRQSRNASRSAHSVRRVPRGRWGVGEGRMSQSRDVPHLQATLVARRSVGYYACTASQRLADSENSRAALDLEME